MTTFAICDRGRDGMMLRRTEDGAPLASDARVGGLLMSRLDFDVQVLDIPRVPEKEVEGLIRYRLRTLYPGSPSETAFDYRLISNGAQQHAAVFISRADTLNQYREAAQQAPLLLPFNLVSALVKKHSDVKIWFVLPGWTELLVYRGGNLVSSTVEQREGVAFDPSEAESALSPDLRELPAVLVSTREEVDRLRGVAPDAFAFVTLDELAAGVRKLDGLFSTKPRSRVVLGPGVRAGILAGLAVVVGVLLFFKAASSAEARYAQAQKVYSAMQNESLKTIAIQKEVDSLTSELAQIQSRKPDDLYLFFSELSAILGSGVTIGTVEMNDGNFRIDAVGSNPLRLMEGFAGNPSFSGVTLSQVVPDERTGKERFSFSGVFHAR